MFESIKHKSKKQKPIEYKDNAKKKKMECYERTDR